MATGGSIVELLDRLADDGAVSASVSCTHGLFTGPAVGRLRNHPMIREVVTTDTVPPPRDWPELCTLSVLSLIHSYMGIRDRICAHHVMTSAVSASELPPSRARYAAAASW